MPARSSSGRTSGPGRSLRSTLSGRCGDRRLGRDTRGLGRLQLVSAPDAARLAADRAHRPGVRLPCFAATASAGARPPLSRSAFRSRGSASRRSRRSARAARRASRRSRSPRRRSATSAAATERCQPGCQAPLVSTQPSRRHRLTTSSSGVVLVVVWSLAGPVPSSRSACPTGRAPTRGRRRRSGPGRVSRRPSRPRRTGTRDARCRRAGSCRSSASSS